MKGTFLHGIFENDNFRTRLLGEICSDYSGYSFAEKRAELVDDFVVELGKCLDMDRIETGLKE